MSLLDLSSVDSQDIKNISDFVEETGVSQRMREGLCRGVPIIASVKRLFDRTLPLSQGIVVDRGVKDEFLDYLLEYNKIADRRLAPDNVRRLINTTYLDLGFTSTSLNLNCANSYGNNLLCVYI